MLKPQDCVILVKLIANPERDWSQRELASELGMSQAEVHDAYKRLKISNLVGIKENYSNPRPILQAAEEYLIHAVKYSFPAVLGQYTRGIATGIGAPVFEDKVVLGDEPLPVWPFGKGDAKGLALKPLYPSIPLAITEYPDEKFYDLLALIDVLRCGRARERNIASEMLKKRIINES